MEIRKENLGKAITVLVKVEKFREGVISTIEKAKNAAHEIHFLKTKEKITDKEKEEIKELEKELETLDQKLCVLERNARVYYNAVCDVGFITSDERNEIIYYITNDLSSFWCEVLEIKERG